MPVQARSSSSWRSTSAPSAARPSDAAFVAYVYEVVLGRTPDAAGARYWVDELQAGAERSEFLAVFLTSALEAAGDSDYLQARVAVASHAAQATITGPGLHWPDLVDILRGVRDAGDAYREISALYKTELLASPAAVQKVAAFLLSAQDDGDLDLRGYASSSPTPDSQGRLEASTWAAAEVQLVGLQELVQETVFG